MLYLRHPRSNTLDHIQVVAVHAKDLCAAVCRHVDEVIGGQPVVDGYDDRPELWYGVELLEMLMRVGRDRRNPVTFADAQIRERGAPAVTALAEFGILAQSMAGHYKSLLKDNCIIRATKRVYQTTIARRSKMVAGVSGRVT